MSFLLLFRIILILFRCLEVSQSKKVRVGVAILIENASRTKQRLSRVLFGRTHLFLIYDYRRTKEARNKAKNREEQQESVLSNGGFGVYVAIAANILWQFKKC